MTLCACLAGLRAKYKCPHCEFESNKGNLTKHMRAKHNEI